MKKVVISGGTGLIGQKLSKLLVESGYDVVILSRNPDIFADKKNLQHLKYDVNLPELTAKIIDGAYSVINLAGAGVADKRWTPEYKKEIYNSRISITSHLVNAINITKKPPESFISTSAIGIYGDRGDEKLVENSKISNTFLAEVCRDWEIEADKSKSDVRVVKLRVGIVLSKDGGALPKLALPVKLFVGGSLGKGNQWMSWIHIDDLAQLYLWCIENSKVSGIINCTAPNPVTMNEFVKQLGKTLHRPSFFKVPELVLKMILGESSAVVLASQRVYPLESKYLGFNFKYNQLSDALRDLLK